MEENFHLGYGDISECAASELMADISLSVQLYTLVRQKTSHTPFGMPSGTLRVPPHLRCHIRHAKIVPPRFARARNTIGDPCVGITMRASAFPEIIQGSHMTL